MFGVAGLALSAIGTIGQFSSNLMGAAARRSQMREQIRADEMQKASTLGLAAARSGASEVGSNSSSTMSYLAGLGAEFDRTIAVRKKSMRNSLFMDLVGAGSQALGGAASALGTYNSLNPPVVGKPPNG